MLDACVSLMKRGTYAIVNTIFKSVQQLIQSSPETAVYNKFEETWKIFEEFMQWIGSERPDPHYNLRPIGAKLAPTVIDALRTIFKPSVAKESPSVQSGKTALSLCNLLKKVRTR